MKIMKIMVVKGQENISTQKGVMKSCVIDGEKENKSNKENENIM